MFTWHISDTHLSVTLNIAIDKNKFNIEGQALHSLNLKIIHPRTKEEMTFTAPIPEDMENLLKYFRQTI